MAEYLFTARTPGEHELASRIEAENAASARELLLQKGLHDIVIHTDDFAARMYGANIVDGPVDVDPALLLEAQKRGGSADQWLGALKNNAKLLVPLLMWNAYSISKSGLSESLLWPDWLGFAATGMLLLVIVWLTIPAMLFESLLYAQLWANWEEAERSIAWLRRYRLGARIAPHMLDFYQAKNLIGMGRTDEGMALFARHRGHPNVPDMLWQGLQASLLDAAKRPGEAGELMRQVTGQMPDSAQVWLDFALNQALYGDIEQAKRALGEAEQRVLNPIMASIVPFVRGEIALREGRCDEAVQSCGQALRDLAPFVKQMALRPIFILVEARYAVALARCGKLEAARQAWAIAAPVLTAHGKQKFLDDWAAAESAR